MVNPLSEDEEAEQGFSARRYEKLQLGKAFERRADYAEACQELALILRQAYSLANKEAQGRLYTDALYALQQLKRMDGRKQQRGALALVRAAEGVLPKQRKAAALKEFKAASLEVHRRQKKGRGNLLSSAALSSSDDEDSASGAAEDLPLDALRTVFAFLDAASLATAGCVCRAWREIADDDSLWEAQFGAVFGQDRASETAAALARLSLRDSDANEQPPKPPRTCTLSSRKQTFDKSVLNSSQNWADSDGKGPPDDSGALVTTPGTALPGWKEAFRSAWRNQAPGKVFASNRGYCNECREPIWIGTAGGGERKGGHVHKPIPWGPQQVAAWVTYSWESSGDSSSEDEDEVTEAQVRAQRKLWAIQVPKTS